MNEMKFNEYKNSQIQRRCDITLNIKFLKSIIASSIDSYIRLMFRFMKTNLLGFQNTKTEMIKVKIAQLKELLVSESLSET